MSICIDVRTYIYACIYTCLDTHLYMCVFQHKKNTQEYCGQQLFMAGILCIYHLYIYISDKHKSNTLKR
jgi:hypothetical protein